MSVSYFIENCSCENILKFKDIKYKILILFCFKVNFRSFFNKNRNNFKYEFIFKIYHLYFHIYSEYQ